MTGRLRASARSADLPIVLLIALVAGGLRVFFLSRVPVFVHADSTEFYLPAFDLAHGFGFDLLLNRTPGYPLFVAAIIALFGDDLIMLGIAQHALGVLTAVLTYLIGRDIFGRPSGLLAGLMVALSAPLLLHEHMIIPESLFTFLLTLSVCLAVRGARQIPSSPSPWLALGAGMALGAAYQARPTALVVLPLLGLSALWWPGRWRQRLVSASFIVIGFAALVGPTIVWNHLRHGESVPSTGRFLYARAARHNVGIDWPASDSLAPSWEPGQAAVRAMILEQGRPEHPAPAATVSARLQETFGLTQAQADRAMGKVALELLVPEPERYLRGVGQDFVTMMRGEEIKLLLYSWSNVKRRKDWQDHARIAHTLVELPDSQRDARPVMEQLLATLFQPFTHQAMLGASIALATLAGILRRGLRPALVLLLISVAVVLLSAVMIGEVMRYRYPVDPLLYTLAAGGLSVAFSPLARLAHRMLRRSARPTTGRRAVVTPLNAPEPIQQRAPHQ